MLRHENETACQPGLLMIGVSRNRGLGEIDVDFFVGVFVVFFCTTATLSTLTAFYGCVDWASRGRESVLGVSVSIFARR